MDLRIFVGRIKPRAPAEPAFLKERIGCARKVACMLRDAIAPSQNRRRKRPFLKFYEFGRKFFCMIEGGVESVIKNAANVLSTVVVVAVPLLFFSKQPLNSL